MIHWMMNSGIVGTGSIDYNISKLKVTLICSRRVVVPERATRKGSGWNTTIC